MIAILPSPATSLLQPARALLSASGAKGYLVGGYVRDLLLGRPSHDLDIVVSGDSLALARRLADAVGGSYYPLDEGRAIGRVVVSLPDGPWTVDVVPLAGALEQDLALRDFTIDAMALPLASLAEEDLHDPFGGRRDLERRTVRALSASVFVSDPARLLRGPRLAAELGFALEPGTAAALRAHAGELARLSPERARDELVRLLELPFSLPGLRMMDDLGLLDLLLPELAAAKGVEQPPEHAWDVFRHNLEALGFAERILLPVEREAHPALREMPWRPEFADHFQEELGAGRRRAVAFKLAALLHDVGKPQTKAPDPSGRIRFFGHATLGAEMAEAIMARLRFSRREARLVSRMVEEHLRPIQISQAWETPTRRAVYRYFRDLEDAAIDTIYLSLADHLAAVGPRFTLEEWRLHTNLTAQIMALGLEKEGVAAPPRLVTGHDLMDALDLGPGPEVGRLLEIVREAQAAGEVRTREEALARAAARREA